MTQLPAGTGPLFTNPSADLARDGIVQRPRSFVSKVTDIKSALLKYLHDGEYLAVGGFSTNRIPVAALHEILRLGQQNLSFSGHTSTHDFQILCAGNMTNRGKLLAKVDIAYIIGLEARGLSPHSRRVVESGDVEICEWTNYAMAVRLKAAAMGVPFLPSRTMLGTDTFAHSAAKIINCPFTGVSLMALPALVPDVAIIHVHEADEFGNCHIVGPTVSDVELSRAARKVIITCERLVSTDEFRKDPNRTVIPFFCVDAVCEVPFGSYPGNMPGAYFSDEDHFNQWLTVEKDLDQFNHFLDEYIYGLESFDEYLEKCGGEKRLRELKNQELLIG